jgi:uncharacterized OsmC-like protein
LTAVAHGEVEAEDGVLVLKRIHVVFTLKEVAAEAREAADRAHAVYKERCPVYRSLHRSIEISSELRIA